MNPLARQTGCPIAAFDWPGWGLPSRPPKTEWEEKEMPNPYELQSQVNTMKPTAFLICPSFLLCLLFIDSEFFLLISYDFNFYRSIFCFRSVVKSSSHQLFLWVTMMEACLP